MFPVQRDLTELSSLLVISDFCLEGWGVLSGRCKLLYVRERLWVTLECYVSTAWETASHLMYE